MSKESIMTQLETLTQVLEDMRQERIEASVVYPDTHWMIKDLDEDILLCSLTINDLRTALYMESK